MAKADQAQQDKTEKPAADPKDQCKPCKVHKADKDWDDHAHLLHNARSGPDWIFRRCIHCGSLWAEKRP